MPQLLVRKNSHIPNYPHFSILFNSVDSHTTYRYTALTHSFCIVPSEPVELPRRGASYIPSG